ncbi:MAG TPA: hypothetical protein DCS97_03250 [Planctomycetes bacterium]|nr:hypothetical protein [Planctomycetota bacterium]
MQQCTPLAGRPSGWRCPVKGCQPQGIVGRYVDWIRAFAEILMLEPIGQGLSLDRCGVSLYEFGEEGAQPVRRR